MKQVSTLQSGAVRGCKSQVMFAWKLQLCEMPPKADRIPFRNLEHLRFSDISYLIMRKTLLKKNFFLHL